MGKVIDLAGQIFGRLTVVSLEGKAIGKGNSAIWRCACDCGNMALVYRGNLKTGNTISCGCYRKECLVKKNTTHGLFGSPEHKSWHNMLQRCNNLKNPDYSYYGGRGITVCERWAKFENFLEDMGDKPNIKLTIERKDNSKGYSLGNCFWATRKQQAQNRRPKSKVEQY